MTDLDKLAKDMGAVPDYFMPGLWHLPGYPELTSGQLLSLALRNHLKGQNDD